MHGEREKYKNEQHEKAMKAKIKQPMDPEEMRRKGLI
jgi:hypothetical protein